MAVIHRSEPSVLCIWSRLDLHRRVSRHAPSGSCICFQRRTACGATQRNGSRTGTSNVPFWSGWLLSLPAFVVRVPLGMVGGSKMSGLAFFNDISGRIRRRSLSMIRSSFGIWSIALAGGTARTCSREAYVPQRFPRSGAAASSLKASNPARALLHIYRVSRSRTPHGSEE